MAEPPAADWEDWEEWDGQSKFSHHMFAGSCAGLVEHLAMFPLDTLRVRVAATVVAGDAATVVAGDARSITRICDFLATPRCLSGMTSVAVLTVAACLVFFRTCNLLMNPQTFKQTTVVDSTGVSLRSLYRQGGIARCAFDRRVQCGTVHRALSCASW